MGGGGADLRRGCFLAKTYAKTKELDPVGGGGHVRRRRPPWIPQCDNAVYVQLMFFSHPDA